jgi:ABC-type sugar transport system ATPase subunit
MLDIALDRVNLERPGGFTLEVTARFPRETHTAIAGAPAAGKSTLLAAIAGTIKVASGTLKIGARDATSVRASQRPLLYRTSALPYKGRWSVAHVLLSALSNRKLDREDRMTELAQIAARWTLTPLLERRLDSLSGTESARVSCAEVEALHPAVVLLDRLFERCDAAAATQLTDDFFRLLRTFAATVINTPSRLDELGFAEHVIVLGNGGILEEGSPSELYFGARTAGAAVAIGPVTAIPVSISKGRASSAIGEWDVPPGTSEGTATALLRPQSSEPVSANEESDFIFIVDEARLVEGSWLASGLLTGNIRLIVRLPASMHLRKGLLIPMRLIPDRIAIAQGMTEPTLGIPLDLLPSRDLTR